MACSTNRPADGRLFTWLDGELDADGHADADAWLRDHPDDAAPARLWAADRDALRARFDPVLDARIPVALRQTVLQAGHAGSAPDAPWRRVAVAAGLLAAGGLMGAVLGAQFAGHDACAMAALPLPWGVSERVRPGGWTCQCACSTCGRRASIWWGRACCPTPAAPAHR